MMASKLTTRRLLVLVVIVLLIIAVLHYGPTLRMRKVVVQQLTVSTSDGSLTIRKGAPSSTTAVNGQLGREVAAVGGWSMGTIMHTSSTDIWMRWEGHADLRIHFTPENGSTECYKVTWVSQSHMFSPHDCFHVGSDNWYGGAEVLHDHWTIEKQPMKLQQFLSNDIGMVRDGYGGVLERYWLSSQGVSITVDDDTPLHVGINKTHLCLKADYQNSWYQNPDHKLPILSYSVCSSKNVLAAHIFVATNKFMPAKQIPSVELFQRPIWSTWVQFKKNITEDKVIKYANDIKKHAFDGCHIEIDDGYTKHYGDFQFDHAKFPSPLQMSKTLRSLGFNVTTWVTPFTNIDSVNYNEVISKGYVVKSHSSNPLVKWWRGQGVVLDMTNPEAVLWMSKQLHKLKEQGVTAFKFDAGESNFLPRQFITNNLILNGNHYGGLYSSHMDRLTHNRQIEVRVGYRSQHVPVMVRMMDKDSDWGYARGIQSLIPTALLFGVLGYPFVLPDMVGGNGYIGDNQVVPSKELYLRWVAATVLLPFIQFSLPPWNYDEETVKAVHDLLELRNDNLEKLLYAAQESAKTAYPIIRPMWWADPENTETHHIDSQFMVGDELIVAPILHKGQTERSVYLPLGTWRDLREGLVYGGRQYIHYLAALNELPVFTRALSKSLPNKK